MTQPLAFVRLINLLKAIDDLPFSMDSYNRHRGQYDYILSQLHFAAQNKTPFNVAKLIACSYLGSQPTAHKRLRELLDMDLIEIHVGEDRREKHLQLSSKGVLYLERCSDLMVKAVSG